MTREAALNLAKEKGLDLIEISPLAKPPVSRIISFDKFRYQQEKKLKQQKLKQRGGELKQVQISVKAARNDLEIKAKKVNEFLAKGDRVEIILVLRGREKFNKDWAREKFNEFIKMIDPEHKVVMEPKFGGRGMVMQVIKK
jgi:translation initiation factor IF-3